MSSVHTQNLQRQFGFSEFRPEQLQVVEKLLSGCSSLAIFPTGSGKSLCYQYSALHLPHLTLVVSPLLALMKDQLTFLRSKGVCAASIDSSLTAQDVKHVMAQARNGQLKILMVSVERFKNERFRQFIHALPVSMLVVDEAHCISEWGHNFRPDYLKLPQYRHELNIPVTLLLTATATNKVKRDMAMRFGIAREDIVQTGFYRNNLDLTVLPVVHALKNETLVNVVNDQLNNGSGIVYVMLQHTAEEVASLLVQKGVKAKAYHAGLDNDVREPIQQSFMAGQLDVVVATIAFGMGVDKSNIRFVIHYDLPKSIENYSQEIGRAGRDGLLAQCIVLANLDGLNTLENFVYGDTPDFTGVKALLNAIQTEVSQGQWEVQIASLSKQCNIKQLPLKTLFVQLELLDILKPKYVYFADFRFKFTTSREEVLSKFTGERARFLGVIFDHADFKRVWGSIDVDSLVTKQHCDRARVVTALDYLDAEGYITLETKKATEVYQVDIEKLSSLEPAVLHRYCVDKQQSEVERIDSLIRFFQLDSCLSVNLARYFGDTSLNAPCKHCSVCRGEVAQLAYSSDPQWPEQTELYKDINDFLESIAKTKLDSTTSDTVTKYLAGMLVPMLSRTGASKLEGFGKYKQHRYVEVKKKVDSLWYKVGSK